MTLFSDLASLVGLKKLSKGDWYLVKELCPFCDNRHIGSMHVNIKEDKFFCFNCKSKGKVSHLTEEYKILTTTSSTKVS